MLNIWKKKKAQLVAGMERKSYSVVIQFVGVSPLSSHPAEDSKQRVMTRTGKKGSKEQWIQEECQSSAHWKAGSYDLVHMVGIRSLTNRVITLPESRAYAVSARSPG